MYKSVLNKSQSFAPHPLFTQYAGLWFDSQKFIISFALKGFLLVNFKRGIISQFKDLKI